METVKYYANLIDPHWIAVVATGLYTHLRQICIIGLCFEQESVLSFDPSYASVLFVFSVLCLLAEYRLWPITLKEPPIQLLYIYEMLIAALSTNLAIQMIWIPMMHVLYCLTQESSKWLTWLNTTMGLGSYSFLTFFANYMAKDYAATYMAFCMSLLSFVWMLDATETLDTFLDTWSNSSTEYLIQIFVICKILVITFIMFARGSDIYSSRIQDIANAKAGVTGELPSAILK